MNMFEPVVDVFADPSTTNELVDRAADARDQYDSYYQKGSGDAGWLSGTTADGVVSICNGIVSGDWVAVELNGFGASVELLGATTDPIGWAATQVSGWMLEHLLPFRAVLHGLAGSPEMIKGYATTWDRISQEMHSVARGHGDFSVRDTSRWHGGSADGYRASAAGLADLCESTSVAASAVAKASYMMAEVVAGARSAVRDIVANLVGAAISATVEEAVTGGLATPVVVVQVLERVLEAGKKVAVIVRGVGRTINELSTLMGALKNMTEALWKAAVVEAS